MEIHEKHQACLILNRHVILKGKSELLLNYQVNKLICQKNNNNKVQEGENIEGNVGDEKILVRILFCSYT